MTNTAEPCAKIRVLLADAKPMENQLLAGALQHQGFLVFPCEPDAGTMINIVESGIDVVVISCSGASLDSPEFGALRTLQFANPRVPKIVLMDFDDRELVLQAFRLGARGLFCLADSSFQRFCECIHAVHRGEVWATARQLNYLLDFVCQAPSLRVVGASGETLLTSREEQVVALVADGLSNRDVATELGLSEHTVKKYLFRIFDKLGISNRVELVLYAMHHGSSQTPQWIA